MGNLAPHIDESMLLREFGRFGPIGSVKIMWPRDDEQRRRGKNTGFVAFMRHEDAEKAKDALDGIMLHDLQLQVGWGKAVPLPAVPVWPPPGGLAAAGGDASGTPVSVAAAPESTRQRMQDGPPPKEQMLGRGPDVEVTIPEDPRQRFVIDAVAYYVMRDGCEFEQVVMERESDNPEFAFMFDVTLPEHAYYRWRIFSLANGDSLRSWRVDPFLMAEGSNRWAPPPMTLVAVAQKSGAQRGERREDAPLPDAQRDRLSDMLRGLTVERAAVRDAMVFALDHADSAADISEILIDALTLAETPGPLKVARLFLLSDILHNTSASVRNASRYRARLQDALPDVFESFQEAYRSAGGRIAQEQLRKNVLKVLRVWRGWYIFSDDFLNGLQATFLRGGSGPAGMRAAASEADGRPVDERVAASLAAMTDDELELKCKHCGLSRRGGREAQIARLLALDAYLNGSKEGGQSTAPDQKPATAPGAAWHEVAGPGCAQPGTASQPSGAINAPGGATEEEQREEVSRAEVAVLDVLGTKGATAEEREGRLVELREGMESGENPPSKRKKTR